MAFLCMYVCSQSLCSDAHVVPHPFLSLILLQCGPGRSQHHWVVRHTENSLWCGHCCSCYRPFHWLSPQCGREYHNRPFHWYWLSHQCGHGYPHRPFHWLCLRRWRPLLWLFFTGGCPANFPCSNPAGDNRVDFSCGNPAGDNPVDLSCGNPAGDNSVDLSCSNPAGDNPVDFSCGNPAGD